VRVAKLNITWTILPLTGLSPFYTVLHNLNVQFLQISYISILKHPGVSVTHGLSLPYRFFLGLDFHDPKIVKYTHKL
jgi:hypothetical protein